MSKIAQDGPFIVDHNEVKREEPGLIPSIFICFTPLVGWFYLPKGCNIRRLYFEAYDKRAEDTIKVKLRPHSLQVVIEDEKDYSLPLSTVTRIKRVLGNKRIFYLGVWYEVKERKEEKDD